MLSTRLADSLILATDSIRFWNRSFLSRFRAIAHGVASSNAQRHRHPHWLLSIIGISLLSATALPTVIFVLAIFLSFLSFEPVIYLINCFAIISLAWALSLPSPLAISPISSHLLSSRSLYDCTWPRLPPFWRLSSVACAGSCFLTRERLFETCSSSTYQFYNQLQWLFPITGRQACFFPFYSLTWRAASRQAHSASSYARLPT